MVDSFTSESKKGKEKMSLVAIKCSDCGFQFDKILKFYTTENPICPQCGGKTERLISRSSFVLAGDGWAKDSYKGEKK